MSKIKRVTETRSNRVYCEDIKPADLFEELELLRLDLDTTKFRIFEGKLRVRDFSYCNLVLELINNDTIKFKFRFKGERQNQIHFKDNCDIIYNYRRKFIELRVNGPVFYEDGTRRYTTEIIPN